MKKILKYLFLFLLISISVLIVCAKWYTLHFIKQATELTNNTHFIKPDTTEVYVLGVLHKCTNKVTYNDLYNILETIKPNIILFERDSLCFDNKMNLKPKWWRVVLPPFLDKYQQSNLEEITVRKYLYHNEFASVKPYEWSLRDKFHKENQILTKPNEIFQKLAELLEANKLPNEQKQILETCYALMTELNKYGDSTLYEINTIAQDSIASSTQNYQYHKIKTIIDSNENFEEYRDFYKINEAYWDIRNKAMAANIETYIKLFPKSRIVVLNGYYHRYYLRQELVNKQQQLNFKLKDIEHKTATNTDLLK